MRTMPTNMTVQDFLAALGRGEIVVNRHYQRSDGVWPDAARSYLIETVLLEFPIPKLALHQITDVTTGISLKELVDGQQRCAALLAFKSDEFKLSSVVENAGFRGLRYSTLAPDQKTTFLNYQLNIDLFLGAEANQIREVFRRMNSYTVPLNAEEHRHAKYQGAFKWFIHRLSLSLNDAWEGLGVFSQKALVRMGDAKLLSEMCHAMIHGIKTTNKTLLDSLYRDNNDTFTPEMDFEVRITEAVRQVQSWKELQGSNLMKPFQMYALLLAVIHVRAPVEALASVYSTNSGHEIDEKRAIERLSRLAQAIDDEVESGKYARFVKASGEKTNVKEEREIRFVTYCEALVG